MHDRWGNYQAFTGEESPLKCFWCGCSVRNRRYCCEEHRDEYYRHFYWPEAAAWCLERYGEKCSDCGKAATRVHHIVPLLGEPRLWNTLNRPENLVALCASCHGLRHAAPPQNARLEKALPRPERVSEYEKAVAAGQLVLVELNT